jgi:hypothetical protein
MQIRPGCRRRTALEPVRQGVRRCFGGFAKDVARGLAVRHDHGSQYMSDHFQQEIAFLGITSSGHRVVVTTGSEVAHLESCIEIILHAFPWSNDTHAQPRKSRVVRTEGQHVIPERSRTGNQPEPLSTQFAAMIASGSRCSTRGREAGRHAAEQDGWWRGCKPERPEGQSDRLKDFVRQPRRWAAKSSIASAVTFI